MDNEEIQEVQPDINEQELELEVEEETTPTPEPEVDWKAEALKQKAINQRLSKKIASPEKLKQDLPEKQDDDIRLTVKELQLAEKKRQFGYEHGLSPEETDAVFKLSPNPTKEVLEDPFVKGGLASLRAKKRVVENTPTASKSAFGEALKKQDATPEELDRAWEKEVQDSLNRRK